VAYTNSVLNLQRALLWARSQNPAIPSPGRLDGTWGNNTASSYISWVNYTGLIASGEVSMRNAASEMAFSTDWKTFSFADAGSALSNATQNLINSMPRAYRTLGTTSAPTSATPPGTTPAPAGPAWDSTLPGGASATSDPVAQAQQQAAQQVVAQAQSDTGQTTAGGGGSFISSLFSRPAAAAAAAASAGAPLLTNTPATGPLIQAPASSTQTVLLVGLGVVAVGGVIYMLVSSKGRKGRRRR